MKRLVVAVLAGLFSFAAFAGVGQIGVVNMQQIFRTSPQIKQMNATLMKKFASRRASIMAMGKQLRQEVQNYQKNKAVMTQDQLNALKKKIQTQEMSLRQAQGKYQRAVFLAQNQNMKQFMNKVRGIVKTIASQKKLQLVLPKNTVLYSDGDLDITPQVLKALAS